MKTDKLLSITNPVIELDSNMPGKNLVIMAAVHGNEPCGFLAINQVFPSLEIRRGKVTFVLANLKAFEQDVRFTEFNLNRCFKDQPEYSEVELNSYEYKRGLELKVLLDKADILLDIHSSCITESEPFVICERNANGITKFLPKE